MPARCCEAPVLTPLLVLIDDGSGHYTVASCASCGGALIERHSFDDWDTGNPADFDMYWWWRMDASDAATFRDAVAACPAPLDPACECLVHTSLRSATPSPLPPSVETPYEDAEVPRTTFAVEGCAIRWRAF